MAEAPQLPPDPLATLPRRVGAAWPAPQPARLPRVGVVLAAGRSERLDAVTRGGSKALLRLGGLSLVERAVRSLLARRLERVLVVVGHDAGPVAAVVGRLGSGRVRAVCADRWSDGNGASLAAAEVAVAGETLFVLATADHVFSEGALEGLLGAGEPAVLVDPAPDRAAWLAGPGCGSWTGPWSGSGSTWMSRRSTAARSCYPEVFGCQRQAAAEGDHTLAGVVTRLARARPLRAVPLPRGCWWRDVDTPQDAQAARVALRRSLGKTADGPVSRLVNRPLSTRVSMALAPLRPAPDLVSLVAFARSLAGAALLAAGQGLAGALLVHAASVADGVDGEVARLQLPGRAAGGRCWTGCWTGSPTRPSWPGLGCGRWTSTPAGGCWR